MVDSLKHLHATDAALLCRQISENFAWLTPKKIRDAKGRQPSHLVQHCCLRMQHLRNLAGSFQRQLHGP